MDFVGFARNSRNLSLNIYYEIAGEEVVLVLKNGSEGGEI